MQTYELVSHDEAHLVVKNFKKQKSDPGAVAYFICQTTFGFLREDFTSECGFCKSIAQLAKEKHISPDVLYSAVEEALITAYKKNFGSTQNVRVSMNKENGEIHVYAQKNIVTEVENPLTEISLDEAFKLNPRYQAGDVVEEEVTPKNFGRIAAQNAKQSH